MKQKPIQLIREEFAKSLAELVETTNLPTFVKIDVLNSMSNSLSMVAVQEYESAKTFWANANKEKESSENKEPSESETTNKTL